MPNFENSETFTSRAENLRNEIDTLRKTKNINSSDPKYAAEIQEEIDARQTELDDLETRH